jgi:hypothetical protein
MGNPIRFNGIFQRLADMLLANQILEVLRTPFPGKDEIRHAGYLGELRILTTGEEKNLRVQMIAGFPRGTRISYCRCFLPDLTGFITYRCAGPSYQLYPQLYSLRTAAEAD